MTSHVHVAVHVAILTSLLSMVELQRLNQSDDARGVSTKLNVADGRRIVVRFHTHVSQEVTTAYSG